MNSLIILMQLVEIDEKIVLNIQLRTVEIYICIYRYI